MSPIMPLNSFNIQKLSLVFITLLHIIMSTLPNATASTITIDKNETDHLALLAIKSKIIHDPQGVVSSWNESLHFCKWEGVACGHRHRRVIIIDLTSRGLVGSLSPYVGNLSFLRVLQLFNNTLQGEIPPQVGHLFRLQLLLLYNNSFEGEIPANLSYCSNLRSLGVGDNKLVGNLPEELGSLSKLTFLSIHQNHFTGGFPQFIGRLTSLEHVSAAENSFTGRLPNALGQLKNLKRLAFGSNELSGIIPPSIYNLSFLTLLSLPNNHLHGTLPPSLGTMLPDLQVLELWQNNFTGPIPLSISNCTALERFEIGFNNFSGKLGVNFGGLRNLNEFSLVSNNLGSGDPDEMNFIDSLANCSNLQILDLVANQFRGLLPNSIGNLSNQLFYLTLGQNFIYGELPSAIGNLVNLNLLSLYGNRFTGTIPTTIGKLQNLQLAFFDGNTFYGEIPESIGNLSFLTELYLGENRLVGNIPLSLGNCKKLLLLDLSQNNLSGTIPKQLFKISSFWFCWVKKKRNAQPSGIMLRDSFLKVSFEMLLKATDRFSSENLIGVGSYGSVYKGILDPSETIVAVKVLNLLRRGASKSFMAECEALRNIRHRNLVKIITSCSSIDFQGNDFKALVYEFMPNGSLESWLHPSPTSSNGESDQIQSLNLLQRINVAVDVLSALKYLHHHCQTPIIHCDLKPSNVLLDSDMVAHVGDFGVARFLQQLTTPKQSSSVAVRGTVGYAAPEYGLGSQVSTKGDFTATGS
ncbi:probable LRR receptor-like serine/threonine-protein kinase At3g47570 [Cornus florida]|uniref:probable LRR receptor-like serine/threonine-protein kinase At3g47570 n=1 Tax=Cornus florida TaxID=4283 RepID=UPI00289C2440|nr:probable LRR receptor-like serine/threonine-protein kinase At3g47570 [Cornus florida]